MRQSLIKMLRAYFVPVIVLILSACGAEDFQEPDMMPHEVGFYVGGAAETRTEMIQDGLSAVWSAGDELAVWAKNSSGSYTLSNQVFKTYAVDKRSGFFTSTLSQAMPDGTYTYYCTYPVPSSVNGTNVTFNIPAVQDGYVTGGADIMIATPVQHGELTTVPDPEDHSGMSMTMNRMMHQLRFYIPENNEVMQSEKITRIELTFPRDVVGEAVMNMADPDQKLVLNRAGRKVSIELRDPLLISSESLDIYNYACVAFAPVKFEEGEFLSVRAFTEDKIAKIDPIDLRSRNMQRGHSTPVMLIVKEIVDYPYAIEFTLAGNNVGENVNKVILTAPSGCIWPTSGTNEYVYDPGRDMTVGESIRIRFADYESYSVFSNKTISVKLETDNAESLSYAVIPEIPDNVQTHKSSISASMPYLLYQNFSSITYNDGHDAPTVGTNSDTYKGITELSSAGLPGWYGTRIGIQSGAARICCRYENVDVAIYSGSAYYKGRLYTPQLSRIKEGKDVTIQVSFKHGSNREERNTGGFFGIGGSKPNKSPILYFGVNSQEVVTNPDQTEGDIIDKITGMIAGSGFSSATPSSLMPMVIKGEYLDKENGSFTNLPKTKTVTIDGVDRYMRLGWIMTTDNSSSNTNANYWLYIDEIKVQIKK